MDTREIHRGRCLVVWGLVTATALATLTMLAPGGARGALGGVREGRFDLALAGCCSLVLVGCAAWAWLVTTVVVVGLVRFRPRLRRSAAVGPLRRLVLLACGVALTGALATPALAAPGPMPVDRQRDPVALALTGLPMPDRAVDTTARPPVVAPAEGPTSVLRTSDVVVVEPGDTLWRIAAARLDTGRERASDADIERAWRRIYDLNRDRIGADPDQITPATRLRVPDRLIQPTAPEENP